MRVVEQLHGRRHRGVVQCKPAHGLGQTSPYVPLAIVGHGQNSRLHRIGIDRPGGVTQPPRGQMLVLGQQHGQLIQGGDTLGHGSGTQPGEHLPHHIHLDVLRDSPELHGLHPDPADSSKPDRTALAVHARPRVENGGHLHVLALLRRTDHPRPDRAEIQSLAHFQIL